MGKMRWPIEGIKPRQLMRNVSGQILADDKFALVEEWEEIASVEHLHYDVNRVLVLKHVEKFDYVGVLADFKHFDFALEQLKIF